MSKLTSDHITARITELRATEHNLKDTVADLEGKLGGARATLIGVQHRIAELLLLLKEEPEAQPAVATPPAEKTEPTEEAPK